MNLKPSNSWQKTLYGNFSATFSLDSPQNHREAKRQAEFLIQSLEIKNGSSLLDIPCGTGRHTLAFAKKGVFVTGVDINAICLKSAQGNCRERKNIQIKKGDMGKLAWARGKFDIVLNMYTSFGYFRTDRENEKILMGFIQALKPGGKIIIQTINRNWILQKYSPFHWEETSKFQIITKRKYDPKTKYMEAHQVFLCKKSKKWEKSFHRIRLYSIPEMKALMKKAGLKKIKVLEEPFSKASKIPHRPIYVAEVSK